MLSSSYLKQNLKLKSYCIKSDRDISGVSIFYRIFFYLNFSLSRVSQKDFDKVPFPNMLFSQLIFYDNFLPNYLHTWKLFLEKERFDNLPDKIHLFFPYLSHQTDPNTVNLGDYSPKKINDLIFILLITLWIQEKWESQGWENFFLKLHKLSLNLFSHFQFFSDHHENFHSMYFFLHGSYFYFEFSQLKLRLFKNLLLNFVITKFYWGSNKFDNSFFIYYYQLIMKYLHDFFSFFIKSLVKLNFYSPYFFQENQTLFWQLFSLFHNFHELFELCHRFYY